MVPYNINILSQYRYHRHRCSTISPALIVPERTTVTAFAARRNPPTGGDVAVAITTEETQNYRQRKVGLAIDDP